MEFDPDSWPACWILEILARDGDAHEFYASKWWRRIRKKVLRDQHGECWLCRQKRPPVITRESDGVRMHVHHLYELRQRPDLALSITALDGSPNLVVLCDSCHWEQHHKRKAYENPERW